MKKQVNLLEGSIAVSLAKLALPIMATSLIQMAYNLIDMIWIGKISSGAVAAVGAAGMYMWLSNGFAFLPRIGGQILMGQSLGAKNNKEAVNYARAALQMGIILGILYGLTAIFGNALLIDFFNLNSPEVVWDARVYLMITCGGIIFSFMNQILTGLLTAMGNSVVSFRATTIGLVINFFLDPILIFGIGPIPGMKAAGAAIATLFAQIIVFLVYMLYVRKEPTIFKKIHILEPTSFRHFKKIMYVGTPTAVQNLIFTGISMIIARMIADWGDAAVAVQKVGSQIESISWMTAEGFASAVNAFTAQNYGAGRMDRVKKGYHTAMGIMFVWGCFTTFALMVFPEALFKIFISEPDVIPMGVDYLRILGLSQLFMCTELTADGTFQGLGRTIIPSVVGIVFNALRIPMAMFLGATILGLNGVWWSISISSILKGIVLPLWLMIIFIKMRKQKVNF